MKGENMGTVDRRDRQSVRQKDRWKYDIGTSGVQDSIIHKQ